MSTDLRGTSRSGTMLSFRDPSYDKLDNDVETKLGLPPGALSAIRTKGERSNADQVSEAGARSVYQIIPETRAAVLRKYGVDAYAGPEQAAMAAGFVLREGLQRNGGDLALAAAEYHGGTDRKNWGKRTAAYMQRVAGNGPGKATGRYNNHEPLPEADPFAGITTEQFVTGGIDLGSADVRRPLPPQRRGTPKLDDLRTSMEGIPAPGPLDTRPAGLREIGEAEAQRVGEETVKATFGPLDRFKAGFEQNSLLAAMSRSIDRDNLDYDQAFAKHYMDNWESIESFAKTPRERDWLREAKSHEDLVRIQGEIEAERGRTFRLNSGGAAAGVVWGLAGGIADPVGWLAGVGTSKAFQLAGVGSQALMAAGRTGAAVASVVAESAVGNVAFTAGLDGVGEYVTASDYALSASLGLGIGVALAPLTLRAPVQSFADKLADDGAKLRVEYDTRARANLGPDATPDQVAAEADRLVTNDTANLLTLGLADVSESRRLLSGVDTEKLEALEAARLEADDDGKAVIDEQINALREEGGFLTAYDKTTEEIVKKDGTKAKVTRFKPNAFTQGIIDKYGLANMADDAERGLAAEMFARAERIAADNPIDQKALKTILKAAGQESTSNTLLSSKNLLARTIGTILLENPQGAAGRSRSAALAQVVQERLAMAHIGDYDNLYHMFRKEQGKGVVEEAAFGTARREFNRRVFAEIEARNGNGVRDAHHAIQKAADAFERGMDFMRRTQQAADVAGALRLGDSSVGYAPHRIDLRAVAALPQESKNAVYAILARQFQDINKFDAEFSRKLAVKYIENAINRARGEFAVPVNLQDPQAADIVFATMQDLGIKKAEAEKMLGKFSRGGAQHTKGRLKLDLTARLPDGKGGEIMLMDLFSHDMVGLYRAYARRVSGEVALAQYGIKGRKGLEVIKKAMISTGAEQAEVDAFDQIAAEFLNTPLDGARNHAFLDNTRIATSVARLGGMGFTQLGEYANGLAALGFVRTLSAVGNFRRLMKEVGQLKKGGEPANPILASIDTLGGQLGMDEFKLTRMFDVRDNDIQIHNGEQIGFFTKAIRAGGNAQAVLSGHRMIMAVQVRGMAEQIVRKAVQYARSGADDIALNDMGIDAGLRARLRANLDRIATFNGDKLESLDLMAGDLTGPEIMALRDAVERGASQIIQRTYIGETGKWAHDGLLKMLFQFRTFGVTSIEKQWGRNQKNYGALKSFAYLIGSMSMVAPIYAARVHLSTIGMSRKKREETIEKRLNPLAMAKATLNYVSAAGLAGDVLDIGFGFASDLGTDDMREFVEAQGIGPRGGGQGRLMGDVIAPGLGLFNDAWRAAHLDSHAASRLLPGGNLPYVQPLLNAASAD